MEIESIWRDAGAETEREPLDMAGLYEAAEIDEGYDCKKCASYQKDRSEGDAITIVWPGDHRTHVHAHPATEDLYKITLKPWQPKPPPLSPGRGRKNG